MVFGANVYHVIVEMILANTTVQVFRLWNLYLSSRVLEICDFVDVALEQLLQVSEVISLKTVFLLSQEDA